MQVTRTLFSKFKQFSFIALIGLHLFNGGSTRTLQPFQLIFRNNFPQTRLLRKFHDFQNNNFMFEIDLGGFESQYRKIITLSMRVKRSYMVVSDANGSNVNKYRSVNMSVMVAE